jgi:hypothetical protein
MGEEMKSCWGCGRPWDGYTTYCTECLLRKEEKERHEESQRNAQENAEKDRIIRKKMHQDLIELEWQKMDEQSRVKQSTNTLENQYYKKIEKELVDLKESINRQRIELIQLENEKITSEDTAYKKGYEQKIDDFIELTCNGEIISRTDHAEGIFGPLDTYSLITISNPFLTDRLRTQYENGINDRINEEFPNGPGLLHLLERAMDVGYTQDINIKNYYRTYINVTANITYQSVSKNYSLSLEWPVMMYGSRFSHIDQQKIVDEIEKLYANNQIQDAKNYFFKAYTLFNGKTGEKKLNKKLVTELCAEIEELQLLNESFFEGYESFLNEKNNT